MRRSYRRSIATDRRDQLPVDASHTPSDRETTGQVYSPRLVALRTARQMVVRDYSGFGRDKVLRIRCSPVDDHRIAPFGTDPDTHLYRRVVICLLSSHGGIGRGRGDRGGVTP